MLNLGEKKVYNFIKTCGLSKKAKAIIETSKILETKYKGQVQRLLSLEELPGVGHKTASVIVSGAKARLPCGPVFTVLHRMVFLVENR